MNDLGQGQGHQIQGQMPIFGVILDLNDILFSLLYKYSLVVKLSDIGQELGSICKYFRVDNPVKVQLLGL